MRLPALSAVSSFVSMTIKLFESIIEADRDAVWQFHSSAEALTALTPPHKRIRWISHDLSVREGAIHEFQVKVGPAWLTWKAELFDVNPPVGFGDRAIKSPFKSWTHRREFLEQGSSTLVRDHIAYELPFGFLGALVDKVFMSGDIDRMFKFRHQALERNLNRARSWQTG